jgi:hypothetical protein
MWKRIRKISTIMIALCLILGLNVLPVNADSNQSNAGAFPAQRSGPPIGFNPVTASDATLKEYGFPARPSDPTALQEWDGVMQHAQNYVAPVPIQSATSFSPNFNGNPYASEAGYAVLSSQNPELGQFNEAYGQWTQTASAEQVGYWIGLGGMTPGDNQDLVQAGAVSGVPQNIKNKWGLTSSYAFFVEDYDTIHKLPPTYLATPVVNAGNIVYVYLQYNGSTSEAFLLNESTNYYTWFNFNSPYYNGDSVAYMYEPTLGNPPKINPSQFSECWFESTTTGLSLFTNYIYYEYEIGVEAYPGPASNASFIMYSPGQ